MGAPLAAAGKALMYLFHKVVFLCFSWSGLFGDHDLLVLGEWRWVSLFFLRFLGAYNMYPGLDKHSNLIQFKSVNSYSELAVCWGLVGREGGTFNIF